MVPRILRIPHIFGPLETPHLLTSGSLSKTQPDADLLKRFEASPAKDIKHYFEVDARLSNENKSERRGGCVDGVALVNDGAVDPNVRDEMRKRLTRDDLPEILEDLSKKGRPNRD